MKKFIQVHDHIINVDHIISIQYMAEYRTVETVTSRAIGFTTWRNGSPVVSFLDFPKAKELSFITHDDGAIGVKIHRIFEDGRDHTMIYTLRVR